MARAKKAFELKSGMGNSAYKGAIVLEDGDVKSVAIITWGKKLEPGTTIPGDIIEWQGFDLDREVEIVVDGSGIDEVVITQSFATETKGVSGNKVVNYCILR